MTPEQRKDIVETIEPKYNEKGIPLANYTRCEDDRCEDDEFDLHGPMNASDDVPWLRRGWPGEHDVEGAKWNNDVTNIDPNWRLHKVGRIFTDDEIVKFGDRYCPHSLLRERSFAMAWDHMCNDCWRNNAVGVSNTYLREMIKDDRDMRLVELAMQSAMQWLGTNCGFGFIEESERLAESEYARLFPALAAERASIKSFSTMIELLNVGVDSEKPTKRHVSKDVEAGGSAKGVEEEVYLPF